MKYCLNENTSNSLQWLLKDKMSILRPPVFKRISFKQKPICLLKFRKIDAGGYICVGVQDLYFTVFRTLHTCNNALLFFSINAL